MRTIYVAGPYRGETPWVVEQNIRRAEELGFGVASAGAVPVVPHTMYRFWDKTLTANFWLEATAELLKRCDAVVFLPDWADSQGARQEMACAKENEIEIFMTSEPNHLEMIRRWVNS